MPTTNAAAAGQFKILGKHPINRLGYGAMRITGKGIWGPPADRAGALATLRCLPELGVDFIDTANSYGPEVSEEVIREALYPYSHVTVATKGGLERSGPDLWSQNGNPSHLVSEAHASRERNKDRATGGGDRAVKSSGKAERPR